MLKSMSQLYQPIGILGGTFDPIHFGHLRMAVELHEAFTLSKVHITPCYQPVHRPLPIAMPNQRLAMVACAIVDEPSLKADRREIDRHGPSYTIDTLLSFRAEMPQAALCLLIGIDAFLDFTTWHRWEEILELAHLIIAHRPGYQLPLTGIIADLIRSRLQREPAFIRENLAGGILFQAITSLEISASTIRKQIAEGKSSRYLLPDNVYHYIKENQIYHASYNRYET